MILSAAVLGALLQSAPTRAIEFGGEGFQGSLDTTVSHGLTFRTEERNSALAADINGNDGNLNYDRGVVSNTSKFTSDLDIRAGGFGAFVRATGFIDFQEGNDGQALEDIEVLDAYVSAAFDIGDAPADLRLGRHVLNWGESTFIPNGINAINPIDVSKLRLPGSELREALLPVTMASVSVSPTDALSMEGFYQFGWEETRIDPVGSYFSTVDYAGPGSRKAVITNVMDGLLPDDPLKRDQGYGFGPLTALINADLAANPMANPMGGAPFPQRPQPEFDGDFASVIRGSDRTPDNSGQWGVALRYLAEELNHAEFGFYVMNYHSRLPVIGSRGASLIHVQAGLAAAGAIGGANSNTVAALTDQVTTSVQNAVRAGLVPPSMAAGEIARRIQEQVGGLSSALAIDRYAKGGSYFYEYPEDIRLVGLSFNTALGASGWALQGEYSLRSDAPLQIAERKVLEEGLRPIITALELSARSPERLPAYLANYVPGSYQGYVERDVSQFQATATRVFGPVMGADSLTFVTEAALMQVHDMPDKDTTPLESAAGGILPAPPVSSPANTPHEADADATSWGYRLAARLDYSNAIGSVNLSPYAQFLHDVNGNSPSPSGPFVEGRTALTLGVGASYLNRWQADIGYTRYAGDGNELLDRDFVAASVKYSF